MSVGDINSDKRGSGARYNDGKVPLEFVPMRQVLLVAKKYQGLWRADKAVQVERALRAAEALAEFEAGHDEQINVAIGAMWVDDLEEAARVFQYGVKKYAVWNWAKGMAWSVPMACAKRHLLKLVRTDHPDEDSGLPHEGHFWCNVLMLEHFLNYYPEGDDRPPAACFTVADDQNYTRGDALQELIEGTKKVWGEEP